MYESEDRAVFEDEISEPEYSKEMFENAEEMIYNIQRRDIDINMHIDNIHYIIMTVEGKIHSVIALS